MNVIDHFPDAHLIETKDLREGDVIAYTPVGQANSFCVAVYDHYGPGGQKYTSDGSIIGPTASGFHLIHRPTTPLPNAVGDMVRIISPGAYSSLKPGDVLTRNEYGDFVNRRFGIGNDVFKECGIIWEQVWFTNMGPDMDVVDAEVLPAEDEPEPAPAPVALPVGPVLIHIASGRYKGAIGRRNYTDRFGTFNLITEEGEHFQIEESEVQESTWEAVTLTRDRDFYFNPPF
ncbi:hypothetical protein [Glutamicibacter sp. 2E12]|uniref:hypothetical protein n=1 Tax=Glutamicibacter sp. 2E12 TaxID=3416181 RepID=UPI003CF1A6FB